MTGIPTLIAFAYVVGPWALANLVALVVLAVRRMYRSRKLALAHSALAALGPAYGLFVALGDFTGPYHASDRNISFLILAGLFLLALLPLLASRCQRGP